MHHRVIDNYPLLLSRVRDKISQILINAALSAHIRNYIKLFFLDLQNRSHMFLKHKLHSFLFKFNFFL